MYHSVSLSVCPPEEWVEVGCGVDCTRNTSGYQHAATLWTLAATATPPPVVPTPNLMSYTKGMHLYHHKKCVRPTVLL